MAAISAIPSRRPRLYEVDPVIVGKLELYVRAGKSYAAAARAAGVSESTWYRWRRLAKAGDRVLAELFRRLDVAREIHRRTGGMMFLDDDDWLDDDDLDTVDALLGGRRR